MRTQRCKHCKDTYIYDENGPIKECSCRKIKQQEAIEAAARSFVTPTHDIEILRSGPKLAQREMDCFIAGVNWAIGYFRAGAS